MSRDLPLIAVIDDEDAVRAAMRGLLQSAGMEVETFRDGAEFLKAVATKQPDCALIDLNMPDVTGIDVLTHLAILGAGVPVIIMTGCDIPDAEALAVRRGAAAYLRKPFTADVLLAAISAAIAGKSPQE